MTQLPDGFAARPFAHRGLHDRAAGRVENSASAVRAAVEAGYAVEIDVQLAADGAPVVFHDATLDRLTALRGPVREQTAAELGRTALTGGGDVILPLGDVLGLIAGRVPVLVEVKDQSGNLGRTDGRLDVAVAEAVRGYRGPVAVMSFNPDAVRALSGLAPGVPRGLTTCAFAAKSWRDVPAARRARLAAIADYDEVGASFVSHDWRDLNALRVKALKAAGATILCWTIRSAAEERAALRVADAVTFEGYRPAIAPA